MKKRTHLFFLSAVLAASLVSCTGVSKSKTSSLLNSEDSQSVTSSSIITSVKPDTSSSSSYKTSLSSLSSESASSLSSSSSSKTSSYSGPRTLNLYGINDFHGSVVENGSEQGILKVGSFLKEKNDEENTLLVNSGDLWQGAIESNYNRGEFLTKAMYNIGFSNFTLGNHEFDWGTSYIEKNKAMSDSYTSNQTPFLAANIYHYNPTTGSTGAQASNLGQEYVIETMENGLKVGIIGTIGTDQWTSITSSFVNEYIFLDPTPIIKSLSDKLRTEEGCDVIILSSHASVGQTAGSESEDINGITGVSALSGKRYVDAVFCAHSHMQENYMFNDVPFLQALCNGEAYDYISLTVSEEGTVTSTSYGVETSFPEVTTDSQLQALYNKYTALSDEAGSEVLGTLDSTINYSGNGSIANLVCRSIADYCQSVSQDIDIAMCNKGRANLSSGDITYANLYKSLPFDNVVYIVRVSGEDLYKETSYNYVYRVSDDAFENSSSAYYTLAVIDYLALHKNTSRVYDYFPSAEIITYLTKSGYDIYNYRDITADYIRKIENVTASDYASSGRYSKTLSNTI